MLSLYAPAKETLISNMTQMLGQEIEDANDIADIMMYNLVTQHVHFHPEYIKFRKNMPPISDMTRHNESVGVNRMNAFGKTPLMYAAHLNYENRVTELLTAGADINMQTITADEAQHTKKEDNHLHGIYFNIKFSRTALDYALENADFIVIMQLLDAGAKRAVQKRKHGWTPNLKDTFAINPNLSPSARDYLLVKLTPPKPQNPK